MLARMDLGQDHSLEFPAWRPLDMFYRGFEGHCIFPGGFDIFQGLQLPAF